MTFNLEVSSAQNLCDNSVISANQNPIHRADIILTSEYELWTSKNKQTTKPKTKTTWIPPKIWRTHFFGGM